MLSSTLPSLVLSEDSRHLSRQSTARLGTFGATQSPRSGVTCPGLGETLRHRAEPASEPPPCAPTPSAPLEPLPRGPMPRHVHLRSKVVMQRGSQGAYAVLPPQDLLSAGNFSESTWSSSCGSKLMRTTHYAGDEALKVPVELISTSTRGNHRLNRRAQVRGRALVAAGCHAGSGDDPNQVLRGSLRHNIDPPELTPELHNDLKRRMELLQKACRVSGGPQDRDKLRYFTKELQEICDAIGVPLIQKTYRRGYGYKILHSFLCHVKELEGISPDLVHMGCGELPLHGFLTFTILITLCDIPWVFTYNSLTHKICNCSSLFPGVQRCIAPAVGKLSNAVESGLADSLAASLAANLSGVSTGPESLTEKIEKLQQNERHFPPKLLEHSRTVKKRVLEFCAQVPTFLSDINSMPTGSGPEKTRLWARFVSVFCSEVSALDLYYMHFEQLYLGLVDKMIGTALEPVRGMSGPCSALVNTWGDPFRSVQTSLLCQRLGLLKQQVSFGGPHNIVHFDSDLLVKAQRVLQMDTYEEVRRMASTMLTNFDALCEVLVNLHDDQIHPELCENKELRDTVIRLEAIWAECQFVLQQGVLDFMHELFDFFAQVSPHCRWLMRIAMQGESSDASSETQADARKMFFETLPILVYIHEIRRDIKLSEDGKEIDGPSNYRELFCAQSDRHQFLRRDIAKFDFQRYQRFRNFLLGVQEEDKEGFALHASYFENVYRQLREVAAFPTHLTPFAALQAATSSKDPEPDPLHFVEDVDRHKLAMKLAADARARWVCVLRVAQTVRPELFPTSKPRDHARLSALSPHSGAENHSSQPSPEVVEADDEARPSSQENRRRPSSKEKTTDAPDRRSARKSQRKSTTTPEAKKRGGRRNSTAGQNPRGSRVVVSDVKEVKEAD